MAHGFGRGSQCSISLFTSKAYDRVSINALLSKLSLIGFNNSALEWFLQLSPTKGTMCSTEWCVIQMAYSKVRNTPGNSSWTSVVSHFHTETTYLSPLAISVPSLPMTQVYILLANQLRQAVSLSALTLMQQQLGRTDGECYSAVPL